MSAGAVKQNLRWPPIVAEAARIVESYEDTGVTLRQLFYRLVAAELLPNTTTAYSTLSDSVEFMDMSAYHESLAREAAEKARL